MAVYVHPASSLTDREIDALLSENDGSDKDRIEYIKDLCGGGGNKDNQDILLYSYLTRTYPGI